MACSFYREIGSQKMTLSLTTLTTQPYKEENMI